MPGAAVPRARAAPFPAQCMPGASLCALPPERREERAAARHAGSGSPPEARRATGGKMAAPPQQPQPPPPQPLTLLQAQGGPPPPSSSASAASSSSSSAAPSASAAAGLGGPPPAGGQASAGVGPPLAVAQAQSQAPVGLQAAAAAQAQDFDPVQRFRLLLPQLKESLQNLMKIAAQNFIQNTNIDSGQKSNDGPVQRVDKSLEEFYALCDQLELCLRLAYECLSQSFDSAKHSPTLVPTATKPDAIQTESLPYTQYLSMIKSQIACAKDIHNALLECSNKITGKVPSQGVL
ncbi:mediator of RNA polymerase II transcription subunit 29 [Pogona vitticeps]